MANPGLFREPIKELETEAKRRRQEKEQREWSGKRKVLLAELEGGDLRDEDGHERDGGHLRDEDD